MQQSVGFIKTTVIGGLVFLIPFVIIVAIAGKAYVIMHQVAEPLSTWLPIDRFGVAAGVNLLAVLLILLLCFLTGLTARSALAGRVVDTLESRLLARMPIYTFIKNFAASFGEAETSMIAVLARFDDYTALAFEIERLEDGRVVVFLPGAPNPWAGSVRFMDAERIAPAGIPVSEAMGLVGQLGVDARTVLAAAPAGGA